MGNQYYLTDNQKEYIAQFIFKRQEELYKKAAIYQEKRKSERGISARQISYENKERNAQQQEYRVPALERSYRRVMKMLMESSEKHT